MVIPAQRPASQHDISDPFDIKHQAHARSKEEALELLGKLGMIPTGGHPIGDTITPDLTPTSTLSPDPDKENKVNTSNEQTAENIPAPVPRRNIQPKPRPRSTVVTSTSIPSGPTPAPRPRPQSTIITSGSALDIGQPDRRPQKPPPLTHNRPKVEPILEESSDPPPRIAPRKISDPAVNTGMPVLPPRKVSQPVPSQRVSPEASAPQPSQRLSFSEQVENHQSTSHPKPAVPPNKPKSPPPQSLPPVPVRRGQTEEKNSNSNHSSHHEEPPRKPARKAPPAPDGKKRTPAQRSMTLPTGFSQPVKFSASSNEIDFLLGVTNEAESGTNNLPSPLVPQNLPPPLIPQPADASAVPPKLPPRNKPS
ncbi:hypothetical protein HOLleu_00317 [Holothuria leucospilota]|uniref:Uncharacterized protein n=1 Tax=Holothuria leucospilota TaxID=206669 RepID=A0A9Q1CM45_HOLLE|nr:hypothetical protein HOLleu_00317 [Holothuria leucospilota]